jgi:endonuclease-3
LLKPAQVTELIKILGQEFPHPESPLKHRSAFELLVAVILSAQCTDARVNTITPLLFPKDHACMPQNILELGTERVRKIIFPTGYFNSKTKAIMGCANALLGKEVPSSLEELTALPGVGNKTAQVIQSQWFKLPAFPVDTHIHRVANRLGLANSGTNRDKTERQVKAQVPTEYWSDLHLQLVFHGRKTCTAHKPQCKSCPLGQLCKYPNKNL